MPAGWDERPCGYLSFADTYAEERAAASARGWPVERVAGDHLHLLVEPEGVAHALTRLLQVLGFDRG